MYLLRRFTRNLKGRDFVCADVHGCYHELMQLLQRINFDPVSDRLFLLGDTVDRGADSLSMVALISGEEWVHSIRGNHEQMAIGVYRGRHSAINYLRNGGEWFLMLEEEQQEAVAAVFDALPVAIEIETAFGTAGLVHAESLPSWTAMADLLGRADTLSKTKRDALLERCLWSRERIRHPDRTLRQYRDPHLWDRTPVAGIDRVYVGHSTMMHPVQLGNIHYLDTGMGKGGTLTCVNLAEPDTYITLAPETP